MSGSRGLKKDSSQWTVTVLLFLSDLLWGVFFGFHGCNKREYEVAIDRVNEVVHNWVPIDVRARNDRQIGWWWYIYLR